jgi:hypothetical protein
MNNYVNVVSKNKHLYLKSEMHRLKSIYLQFMSQSPFTINNVATIYSSIVMSTTCMHFFEYSRYV